MQRRKLIIVPQKNGRSERINPKQNQLEEEKVCFKQHVPYQLPEIRIQKDSVQTLIDQNIIEEAAIPKECIKQFEVRPPPEKEITIQQLQNNEITLQKTHSNDLTPKLKKFVLEGMAKTINTNSNFTCFIANESAQTSSLQVSSLLSSSTSQAESIRVKIPDFEYKKYSFDLIQQNKNVRETFIQDMKSQLAKAHNVPLEAIRIVQINKGSIEVDYVIEQINAATYKNNPKNIDEAREQLQENLKIKDLKMIKCKKTYILNLSDFDERGNFNFTRGNTEKRGGLDYFQPSAPWKKVGLNVLGKYENDQWLKMDGNEEEWAVAFHGVGDTSGYAQAKIALEGTKIGPRQAYKGHRCLKTGKVVGKGIYFSPHIEVAEGFSAPVEVDGKKTKLIFQCRVRPSAIKYATDTYWVINDPDDVRPYGIVYKTE